MTLQDDVVGLLMSLTNHTLFTTVSITNSLLRWVVASTPRVADSLATVSATVWGKYSPLAYATDTAASPNTNNYYVTLLESYSKIINTVMLVFAVWIVLKTAAFVWKSLLTLWDILTTVWKLLTWVATGLRNVAQRCGWRRHKRDKEEEEEGTEDCVATDEASHYHDSVQERTITATHTNSGPYSFEQADNQPSVSSWGFPVPGVTWYYQNPGTEKLVPWITPPQVPVPPQAQMIPFHSPNTATTVEYSHLSAPYKPPAASPSVSPDVMERDNTGQQRVLTSNSMVHAPSQSAFSPSRKLSHGGVDWSMNLDQPFGREDSNNESSSSFAESTHLARTATMEIPTLVTTSHLPITAATGTGTTPHEPATTEKGAPPSDENLKKRKAGSAANVAVGDEPRVEEQEAAIIITTLQDQEVEEMYVDRPSKKHKHGQEGLLHDSNSGEDEDYMKF